MQQQVGKKEIKELNSKLKIFDIEISKKEKLAKDDNFYIIKGEIRFFEYEDYVLPTLKMIYSDKKIENSFKKATIDMGAVKFAIKGADMMRPGIPSYDEGIKKGDPVLIVDESHSKPIAIGIAIFSSEDFKKEDTGKAIKNIHYIGDAIWHNNEKV